MSYEKLWENLNHKHISNPFGVSKLPYFVDLTTRGTEFPRTCYSGPFQDQIDSLIRAETYVRLWEPESPRPIGGTVQIKEDIRASYSLCTSITPQSDVDIVLAQSETGTNHCQDFQRHLHNLSHVDANAFLPEPESPQLVDETTQIEAYLLGSYSLCTSITQLSDVDVVVLGRETGTYYSKAFQRLIKNLSQTEGNAIIPEPKSPQLVDEMAQIEDVPSLFLSYPHRTSLSDVDAVLASAETGTAITGLTELRKSQAEKQKSEISEQFDILAQRKDNWDERGSLKPTDLTLAHAKQIMEGLLDSVISGGHWFDIPTISSDGDGNVTAAWYKDKQQLHLQIGEHEAEYFRIWGTNIDTEMEVDYLKPENYLMLWKWLINDLPFPDDIGSILRLYPTMEMAM